MWNVAAENGYHTLYGCTACNIFMGLHHAATDDGHVFHDTYRNLSGFQFSFPPGNFLSSDHKQGCVGCSRTGDPPVSTKSPSSLIPWSQHSCHIFEEAKFSEDILQCEMGGPLSRFAKLMTPRFTNLRDGYPSKTVDRSWWSPAMRAPRRG